ncbi:MAG: URC4/urg3 family protein [Casimicrobiaceae bacterium]
MSADHANAVVDNPAQDLQSVAAIRARCGNIAAAVTAGRSDHFTVDRARLDDVAARVAAVTRQRYPSLAIPYHSRWRHFEAGGVARKAELDLALAGQARADIARAQIDLAVVSVLLDAGAGPAWSYAEASTGQRFARSEGLGVASFRAFMAGAFSTSRDDPCRVDGSALAKVDAAMLAHWFQVAPGNPLVGLEGRAALLRRLGAALAHDHGSLDGAARPGALFDMLTRNGVLHSIRAEAILVALFEGLGSIWLTGNSLEGVPLGDVWRHPRAGGDGGTAGWVPFHKLSQWLAYSLFEPFEWAGVAVAVRDDLTGLPEYRNGGLLLDAGVLALRDPDAARRTHDVGSPLVVEWRALTVVLLDELAPRVRTALGVPDLPLACILEGGTWATGRVLAAELRDGTPPLTIQSDGTVF